MPDASSSFAGLKRTQTIEVVKNLKFRLDMGGPTQRTYLNCVNDYFFFLSRCFETSASLELT